MSNNDEKCQKCHGAGIIKHYGAKITLGEERRDHKGRKVYQVNKLRDNWIEVCPECFDKKSFHINNKII